ncbi:energy transducer TonB [Stenotrophomonas sp. 24(2023)]|nr:energy transducer TonB [Stenotrophomonas sp. 24(2023)]WMJ71494.1 energy transducer TonB [Stenotrophomonas sp. 24(2023)]
MPEGIPGGTVVLTVAVGADGRVRSVSVARSSGQPRLDEAARRAARDWEVSPTAIARSGPVTVQVPIRFEAM